MVVEQAARLRDEAVTRVSKPTNVTFEHPNCRPRLGFDTALARLLNQRLT